MKFPMIDGSNFAGFLAGIGLLHIFGGKLSWELDRNGWVANIHNDEIDGWNDEKICSYIVKRLQEIPKSLEIADTAFPSEGSKKKQQDPKKMVLDVPTIIAALREYDDVNAARLYSITTPLLVGHGERGINDMAGKVGLFRNYRNILSKENPKEKRRDVKAFTDEYIREAIFTGWRYRQPSNKTGFDPNTNTFNVLRESSKAISALGVEALAVFGSLILTTITVIRGNAIKSTSIGFHRDRFIWALSSIPRGIEPTRDLLLHGEISTDNDATRRTWMQCQRVAAVFASRRTTSANGNIYLLPTQTIS